MTELRKLMEGGISSDEILEALQQIVVNKVVENRARMVELQHYGYPQHDPSDTAEFLAALRKIITHKD